MFALTAFSVWADGGLVVPEKGPFRIGGSFSPAKTWVTEVDGDDALVLSFSIDTNIPLVNPEGEKVLLPFHKNMKYALLPSGKAQTPWLISHWQATWSNGDPVKAEF